MTNEAILLKLKTLENLLAHLQAEDVNDPEEYLTELCCDPELLVALRNVITALGE